MNTADFKNALAELSKSASKGLAPFPHNLAVIFNEIKDVLRTLEGERDEAIRLCDHLASCSKRAPKWRCVDEDMPDDDQTVLLHLQGGEVWTGFHDAGQWRFVSADPISEPVLNWMPFPEPPEL